MVYNTQIFWIFELCPSSGILETRKHNVSKLDLFPFSGEGGRYLLIWVPYKELTSVTGHLKLALFKGPN
jgi:hypothetical protein